MKAGTITMMHPGRRRPSDGMSMVEVMIASVVLAFVALAAVGAMIIAAGLAQRAKEDSMALEIMNRQLELVRSAPSYRNLGLVDDGLDVSGFLLDDAIQYDPSFPTNGPIFTIHYDWFGFGLVFSSGANSLTWTAFPGQPYNQNYLDGNGSAIADFKGRRVVIRDGVGRGQIANITTQDAASRTFTTSCAMNGYGTSQWLVAPGHNSYFEVDGGKTLRVSVKWTSPRGESRSIVRWVFIPFRVDKDAAGNPQPLWPLTFPA